MSVFNQAPCQQRDVIFHQRRDTFFEHFPIIFIPNPGTPLTKQTPLTIPTPQPLMDTSLIILLFSFFNQNLRNTERTLRISVETHLSTPQWVRPWSFRYSNTKLHFERIFLTTQAPVRGQHFITQALYYQGDFTTQALFRGDFTNQQSCKSLL